MVRYCAGGLEVGEYLGGAKLVDQPGDAEVAGLDGTAQLDAGQPVGVVDVGVRGAHDACSYGSNSKQRTSQRVRTKLSMSVTPASRSASLPLPRRSRHCQ